jgi:hypothetical protein
MWTKKDRRCEEENKQRRTRAPAKAWTTHSGVSVPEKEKYLKMMLLCVNNGSWVENICNFLFGAISPSDHLALILSTLTLFVSTAAAFYIPRRIMVNQLYAALVQEYRTTEMGEAVLEIIRFYIHDCGNDASKIEEAYKRHYEEEIGYLLREHKSIDFSKTLHFQRRKVSQFYIDMATLRYDQPWHLRLSDKQMRFFTQREAKLVAILLHMTKPAGDVFEEAAEVPSPETDTVPMNQMLARLYNEIKEFE